MSRGIERESGIIVRSRPPRQAESPTDEEEDDCDDKDAKICGADDEGKVCRGFLFTQREGEVPFFSAVLFALFRPAILWRPIFRRAAYVLWPPY